MVWFLTRQGIKDDSAMMLGKKKTIQQRQDDALVYISEKHSVYEVDENDFELIEHLLENHKLITSYRKSNQLIVHTILLIMEKI